jgi:cardiolipin synthase
VSVLALGFATITAAHAIMYRRDSRSALLWVGLVWLAPIVGACLYALFGINRVRRKATRLRAGVAHVSMEPSAPPVVPERLSEALQQDHFAHFEQLERVVDTIVARPLVPGNRIGPLVNGTQAYQSMLAAIDAATLSVSLATYIFNSDKVGERFVSHLSAARRRGVEVRVLVDDVGKRYSWPRITRALRRSHITHALFHPRLWTPASGTINLRNHRKTCVVDGCVGFTGGINIQQGHVLEDHGGNPIQDLHFRIDGPVVRELQEVFAEDWSFAAGEALVGTAWFPRLPCAPGGSSLARVIADGPDESYDDLRRCLLGALSVAQRSIRIVTPYFLPDASLISAINVATMRGVAVDVLIPSMTNVPLVQWAMRATLWQVLQHRCRVWLSPPPFDHTKLMLVDDCWVLLGSANWDARSLRLNFELNVEVYDPSLAASLGAIVERKRLAAKPLTLEDVDSRGMPERLRDGVARLFSPVL